MKLLCAPDHFPKDPQMTYVSSMLNASEVSMNFVYTNFTMHGNNSKRCILSLKMFFYFVGKKSKAENIPILLKVIYLVTSVTENIRHLVTHNFIC